jgi:hypothetical protein
MMRAMVDLSPCQWLVRCAARLGKRWRTVPLTELEAAAIEVWRDERLRELTPEDAAACWLAPVSSVSPDPAHDEDSNG